MNLTPRQGYAYLEFSETLDRAEFVNDLRIACWGAQGDPKAVDKTIKELGG